MALELRASWLRRIERHRDQNVTLCNGGQSTAPTWTSGQQQCSQAYIEAGDATRLERRNERAKVSLFAESARPL
jgi:hypothetical protein